MTWADDGSEGLQGLLAGAIAGNARATEDLLAAVHQMVHRYCRVRLSRYPAAEYTADDVAQEVCIAVLSALSRYVDEGKPFEAYVYKIAAHKVADAQRRTYRQAQPQADIPDVIDLTDMGPSNSSCAMPTPNRCVTCSSTCPRPCVSSWCSGSGSACPPRPPDGRWT